MALTWCQHGSKRSGACSGIEGLGFAAALTGKIPPEPVCRSCCRWPPTHSHDDLRLSLVQGPHCSGKTMPPGTLPKDTRDTNALSRGYPEIV